MVHQIITSQKILNLSSEEYKKSFDDIFQYILNLDDLNDQSDLLADLLAVSSQYIPITEWYNLLNEVLSFYDYSMPENTHNLHRDLSLQQLRLLENIGEQSITEVFEQLPSISLPEEALGLKLMAKVALFSRIENWEKFRWIALEILNYSLENGKSEITVFGCLALSKYMVSRYESVPIAKEYAEVALKEIKEQGQWYYIAFLVDYAFEILPWTESSERSLTLLENAFQIADQKEFLFQKEEIKLRYLQFLIFCGYSRSRADNVLSEKFGDHQVREMTETVDLLLNYLQLSSITKKDNHEKVIMILDNEPSLYEGTLLHPMLLLLRAIHVSTIEEEKQNKLHSLRRIIDRFKYWAGYSEEVFQCWVYFLEAEWRWENEEFEKSDQLYLKALEKIATHQNDLKCLIRLRRLARWVRKDGKTEKNLFLYKETEAQYIQFNDAEAIVAFRNRFFKLVN